MIKVENVSVMNFDNALRGMRNPMESWAKSDSYYPYFENNKLNPKPLFKVGDKDLELALKLIKSGSDHSKFMRQIFVSVDITAPLYWWKEADTYKVATVANSTSTMHKMGSRKLRFDDFSWDKETPFRLMVLDHLNSLIGQWQQDKENKEVWRELIQDLPSSFNQMRTWTGNYSNLRNIYYARKNHKLSEWRELCKVIESLPYSELITSK